MNPAPAPHAAHILDAYMVKYGQSVEVELMVPSPAGIRLLEGTIITATTAVLVVETSNGRVTNRLPWHAIANVRNPIPVHPAN